ncbi:MAG: hypothetical protein FAZ92_00462 [Accumulibacter sp.]|uniref:hypothetical protein n=1 Tax=Accumulibacter sp. TaxID=2053492 RepID=UPI0011F80EF0|nr:hypothetical protein [Accumulibacter sp.]QKS29142.1 MAG: hypothetical protein HT579_09610 [Candidatus Accumulibacter similis]TLD47223.1 MAG: hypothetical protein FAZ92_00462 [Accumulibacter sp.]
MPSSLKPPTRLEEAAAHPIVESALTAIGAFGGLPGLLLPILSNTLASQRHHRRINDAFASIDATLRQHADALHALTDSQYKLISEAILALLHTTSEKKIAYLRRSIANGVRTATTATEDATALGRVLRDVSAEEAEFLLKTARYGHIGIGDASCQDEDTLWIALHSAEGVIAGGLVSLGLLLPETDTYGGHPILAWSPLASDLLALLQDIDS